MRVKGVISVYTFYEFSDNLLTIALIRRFFKTIPPEKGSNKLAMIVMILNTYIHSSYYEASLKLYHFIRLIRVFSVIVC
jgi:hypothetical protein